MKTVFVAFFAVISVASAQKFFFSDAPAAPAGVPGLSGVAAVPAVPGAPLVPGVVGGPLVPGLSGFQAAPAPQFSAASFNPAPSAPLPHQNKFIPILEHTQVKNADGSYNLRFETANGIAQQEQSQVTLNHKGEPIVARIGSYGYTAPDGTPVSISYIADEHGFRVSGNPLPVAPAPISAAPAVPAFF